MNNEEMMSEEEFCDGMLEFLDTCLQEIEDSSKEEEE